MKSLRLIHANITPSIQCDIPALVASYLFPSDYCLHTVRVPMCCAYVSMILLGHVCCCFVALFVFVFLPYGSAQCRFHMGACMAYCWNDLYWNMCHLNWKWNGIFLVDVIFLSWNPTCFFNLAFSREIDFFPHIFLKPIYSTSKMSI